jgi:hypothetical protein
MSTTSPPQAVPRKSRRRWYIAAVLLLIVMTPVGYYFIAGWQRNRELEAIYREIDATDPNWRWPDLVANLPAPPPDDQNAALQVWKVRDLLMANPIDKGVIAKNTESPPNARLPEEKAKVLRGQLDKAGPIVLEEARKLRQMPCGRFPIDPNAYSREANSKDVAPNVLPVLYLLRGDAALREQDDDIEGAAESCQALLHGVSAINDHPTLIGQMLRIAGQLMYMEAIERVLGQGTISKERLANLQAALARETECDPLQDAMRGERAFRHQLIVLAEKGEISRDEVFIKPKGPKELVYRLFGGLYMTDYAQDLRFIKDLVEASKRSGDARSEALTNVYKKWGLGTRPTGSSSAFYLMGAAQNMARDQAALQARTRCAITAIAAERYRLEKGNWPMGVNDLIKAGLLKEPLLDPYDGKPLRWNRTATGLVIYSVGPDNIDGGGVLNRKGNPAGSDDMGFELWSPKFRGIPAPK